MVDQDQTRDHEREDQACTCSLVTMGFDLKPGGLAALCGCSMWSREDGNSLGLLRHVSSKDAPTFSRF
eukprot:696562-Pelagomonas_calceolata.AAC.1